MSQLNVNLKIFLSPLYSWSSGDDLYLQERKACVSWERGERVHLQQLQLADRRGGGPRPEPELRLWQGGDLEWRLHLGFLYCPSCHPSKSKQSIWSDAFVNSNNISQEFNPNLIIISAGFDGAKVKLILKYIIRIKTGRPCWWHGIGARILWTHYKSEWKATTFLWSPDLYNT